MAKSSSAKKANVSALDYIAHPAKYPAAGACAIFGDDFFLKREVLSVLRRQVLGDNDGEFSLTSIAGPVAKLHEVFDALSTVSLFGSGRRLVIIEDADPFVTLYRSQLEDYVARPAKGSLLVLEVKTWPATTRLAKAVAASGLSVECNSPSESQTKRWLAERATTVHGVRLEGTAADVLLELLPADLGVLDQELTKLALLAGPGGVIDSTLVEQNVGGWRTRVVWDMVDAVADGRARDALGQMHRLITAGDKPHALLPQMAATLRRFPLATRLKEEAEARGRRLTLRDALSQAGVPPFKLGASERQLLQIGRARARQLTAWLLAADLAIKDYNSSDKRARTELERLIVRLSKEAKGAPAGAR